MRNRVSIRKKPYGQADHVDAWLMSYADLITLLFMLFVVLVSMSVPKRDLPHNYSRNATQYPSDLADHYGPLPLGLPHDELYRALTGIVISASADHYIAIEKTASGVWIDISAPQYFEKGSAIIPENKLPILKMLARTIRESAPINYTVEIEGHTDDAPLENSAYANNWELSAMRAAHIASLLVDEGVPRSRLRATSYAGNHPIVPNADLLGRAIPANHERNQRVMIHLEMPEKLG